MSRRCHILAARCRHERPRESRQFRTFPWSQYSISPVRPTPGTARRRHGDVALYRYNVKRSTVEGVSTVEVGRSQLLKGVLDLVVLAVLDREDSYGYEVVRALRAAGLDEVGEASVYGTLTRLFRAGLLASHVMASETGPHRKYYGLTADGRSHLVRARTQWDQFQNAIHALLAAPQGGTNHE